MSISLPTYSRLELPLLGRRERVRAIIATGLRREFRRPAAIVVTAIGAAFTTITSIVLLFFAPLLLPPGQRPDLTFFAVPASNGFVLFFVSLMAAVIGAGLIADDMQSMAFTLYMSRPITQTDYLLAKAAILAPLVAMVTIVPLLLTALVAALLGRVSMPSPRPSARESPASSGRTAQARARCSSSSSGNSTRTKARSRCSARTRGTTSLSSGASATVRNRISSTDG